MSVTPSSGLMWRLPSCTAKAAAGDALPRFTRQPSEGLVRLAAHCNVATGLAERGRGRGRAMRPDSDFGCALAESGEPLHRHSQLRRRAAPEQVRRRGRDHQEIRSEAVQDAADLVEAEAVSLGIDEQSSVAGSDKLVVSEQQFERVVRLATAKVGRTCKRPRRIYKYELHSAHAMRPSFPNNANLMLEEPPLIVKTDAIAMPISIVGRFAPTSIFQYGYIQSGLLP